MIEQRRQDGRMRGAADVTKGVPSVSVLTPTLLQPHRVPLLHDVYADLCSSAVAWEWVIVVDGTHARPVPASIASDSRVRVVRTGSAVGAAAARNLGLGFAAGRYITAVDDDDRLPAGSLDVRVAAARRSHVPWVGGMIADARGGVISAWDDCPLSPGPAAAGDIWRTWGCPCLPFPLGPTTLLVEAALLRRVGGWQGLPQAEDFGMAIAVTGAAPGIVLPDVVYIYRRHDAQMTAHPDFDRLESLVRSITFERGRLCAATATTTRPTTRSALRHSHPAQTSPRELHRASTPHT